MTAARRTAPQAPLDPAAFRASLRRHPAAVAVITCDHPAAPGQPTGFTATSVTSASLSPPLVSFYASTGSASESALRAAGHFGVNVLAAHQERLADTFASRSADRFADVDWAPGPFGVPLLTGAALQLVCRRHSSTLVGDHTLIVGLAVAGDDTVADGCQSAARQPLLYHDGRYSRLQLPCPPASAWTRSARPWGGLPIVPQHAGFRNTFFIPRMTQW
jgi:flavin reductase (DIM6/NTAB) family NADH-FMN oxidoreductase RutF